jgi:REP element-mobilizing transposase RayT
MSDDPLLNGWHSRGYLPHLKREGATYFVTFRLADSLPRELLERHAAQLAEIERAAASPSLRSSTANSPTLAQRLAQLRLEQHRAIERALDLGSGACHLGDPEIARLTTDTLVHFHGERYTLEAWVIMPNHVHVLLTPLARHRLGDIVRSWKQYVSLRARRALREPTTNGRFWQPEAYDHWVRDDAEKARIRRYIHDNPVKASLCKHPEDWPWSSASHQ